MGRRKKEETGIPWTKEQNLLREAPADNWFLTIKRQFYDKVLRDMVNSPCPELHERLLSIDAKDYIDLKNMKAIYNDGKWLDKQTTETMIMLLTVMKTKPNSVADKTQKTTQDESIATTVCITIGIFFAIPILCCLHRDLMILFGALYFAAFPVMLALHGGISIALGLLIGGNISFKTADKHGFDVNLWGDKLLFEKQLGFRFDKSTRESVLNPFFDIDNYIAENFKAFSKCESAKQIECKDMAETDNDKTQKGASTAGKVLGYFLLFLIGLILLIGFFIGVKPWIKT